MTKDQLAYEQQRQEHACGGDINKGFPKHGHHRLTNIRRPDPRIGKALNQFLYEITERKNSGKRNSSRSD